MKSARELFEELGYTYQESYFEEKLDEINYSKSGDYAPQIIFNFNHKCVMVYRKENKASWFDVKVLQAINQQINELGWNDTTVNLDVKLDGKKVMEATERTDKNGIMD